MQCEHGEIDTVKAQWAANWSITLPCRWCNKFFQLEKVCDALLGGGGGGVIPFGFWPGPFYYGAIYRCPSVTIPCQPLMRDSRSWPKIYRLASRQLVMVHNPAHDLFSVGHFLCRVRVVDCCDLRNGAKRQWFIVATISGNFFPSEVVVGGYYDGYA